jgi:hypothetical protein
MTPKKMENNEAPSSGYAPRTVTRQTPGRQSPPESIFDADKPKHSFAGVLHLGVIHIDRFIRGVSFACLREAESPPLVLRQHMLALLLYFRLHSRHILRHKVFGKGTSPTEACATQAW